MSWVEKKKNSLCVASLITYLINNIKTETFNQPLKFERDKKNKY